MLGHGGSSAGSYLADPTSPIPSHCAVIILFQSVPVHQLSRLALQELRRGFSYISWEELPQHNQPQVHQQVLQQVLVRPLLLQVGFGMMEDWEGSLHGASQCSSRWCPTGWKSSPKTAQLSSENWTIMISFSLFHIQLRKRKVWFQCELWSVSKFFVYSKLVSSDF